MMKEMMMSTYLCRVDIDCEDDGNGSCGGSDHCRNYCDDNNDKDDGDTILCVSN